MREIYEVIKEIQNTSGRNDKESIIKTHKNNEGFKLLLKYVFDPYIIFGISGKKLNKFSKKATGQSNEFGDLFHLLRYLTLHNTGNDTTLMKVSEFLAAQDEEMREFYSQVICKSLKIGANVKSINKALNEEWIREFSCMLAKKFEDEQHKLKGKEFVITEKLDGMRVLIFVENDTVKAFSRQGQPVEGLVEIVEHAKHLPDSVYDGELLIANADDFKDRDVLQETLKISRKDGEKKGLVFHVFDMLPSDEFYKGTSNKKYIDRRKDAEFIVEQLRSPFIKMLPVIYQGKDLSVIPDLLEQMDSVGKEGSMLNLNEKYQCKRSSNLLKIKSMQTFDEVCLEVVEGDGKYKGMLGAIVVNYKGFPLSIGSGFTDEQRRFYYENPDEIVGRVIEVQYFRESNNANGGLSVSFPIFKQVRENGKEVSYF